VVFRSLTRRALIANLELSDLLRRFLSGHGSKSDSSRFAMRALRGSGAEGSGDAPPLRAIGEGARQMQHDATHRALDSRAEFEQTFSQGADLSTCTLAVAGHQAQLLHQHVSGGGQQHPQLVGEEARAAGAVDFKSVMQLFYPVLDLGAAAVDLLIQPPRRTLEIGDDEARVVLWCAAFELHDLGFDDHVTFALLPAVGRVASVPVYVRGLARAL